MQRSTLGLKTAGFRAYLATQFLGALNDNTFRYLLLGLFTSLAARDAGYETRLQSLASALFALPFVLFAPWAGAIADRYRKSTIFVWAKLVEIGLMLGVVAALWSGLTWALFALLFLTGVHSTFFGPAKYGYLGETLGEEDLSQANGLVNMTTVMAAVGGQVLGGALYAWFPDALPLAAGALVVIALLGTLTSLAVPRVPAAKPGAPVWGALPEMLRTGREVFVHRDLRYTVAGIGHFYLLAALLQTQLFNYAEHVLGASVLAAASFVAVSVIGIALGSLLAARWSEHKVELGLVPLGALIMSAFVLALAFVPGTPLAPGDGWAARLLHWGPAALCVLLLGVGGGLFIVPLMSNLQFLAPADAKGRFLAFGNMISFVGIFLSAAVLFLLGALGLSERERALAVGIFSLVGTSVSLWLLPEAFLRLCGWLLAHSVYRIRVLHPERLPETGGALLVANHVSWVDWLVLAAITRRRVRFLIYRRYYDWWPIHWLLELAGCIPVASGDAPEVAARSLEVAGRALQEGHLVAIFAEGSLTRTGHLHAIRRGYQRIVQDSGIPIIPVHLDGLWGSIFSHEGGRVLWKPPRAIPYPVTVTVGEPLSPRAEPFELRAAIQRLSSEAWEVRKTSRRPLHVTLLREGRLSTEPALIEPGRRPLSRAAALARALALRDALVPMLGASPNVGVALAPGQDGALAVLALLLGGRVPVPLSAALESGELAAAARRAGVHTVLSGGAWLARLDAAGVPAGVPDGASAADLPVPLRALDVTTRLALLSRGSIRAWRLALTLLPFALLERLAVRGDRRDMDRPAVILFTAGSTGEPKGVALSHLNVLANVESVQEVLDLSSADRLLATAPLDQAMGYTQALWLALLTDAGVVFAPDPLDGRAVGSLVASQRATILFATPRLLERYLRQARSEHFGGLRLVFSHGEKLLPRLHAAFEQRFGLFPLEAYASTECAGLVALNTPDVRRPGVFQRGERAGTVGHPLPGVAVEVVDAESGVLEPNEVPGRLRIRGPNVMSGYFDDPRASAPELPGGWYMSGDLATVDEDGFITLTGRFKRASILHGERVSHSAVEDAIAELLGSPGCPVAVGARRVPRADAPVRADAAMPTAGAATVAEAEDELVVFYVAGALDPARIVGGLERAGLAPAAVPRAENFLPVEDIPLLPGGTVDYRALQRRLAFDSPAPAPTRTAG
ncbi:MAG TPA: MFS transporter [Planctomycetota bacterium]|nr:MFS transporter [Planctomycetota bacterium]